jgi:hypothetical protein
LLVLDSRFKHVGMTLIIHYCHTREGGYLLLIFRFPLQACGNDVDYSLLSYPRRRVSLARFRFPLKTCGNDVDYSLLSYPRRRVSLARFRFPLQACGNDNISFNNFISHRKSFQLLLTSQQPE